MYSLILMTAMGTAAPETPSHGLLRCLLAPRAVACYGCVGCWGCTGCYGCWGGCWSAPAVWAPGPGYRGWWGPYYGHGCYGAGCVGTYGTMANTSARAVWGADYTYSGSTPTSRPSHVPGQVNAPASSGVSAPNATSNTSARIVLEVPHDAKLYVDDQLMKNATGERHFYTPALKAGEQYFYDVRIEMVQNGKTISESKKVIVRAGDSIRESFKGLGEPTAIAGARTK